jgi:predicted transcriptional regulator
MHRIARLDTPGLLHHVMIRGIERRKIFDKVLSGNRWKLLKVMTDTGPMSIREAARRLGRDVKAVHRDVHMLLNVGILQKTDKGQIEFPFNG